MSVPTSDVTINVDGRVGSWRICHPGLNQFVVVFTYVISSVIFLIFLYFGLPIKVYHSNVHDLKKKYVNIDKRVWKYYLYVKY